MLVALSIVASVLIGVPFSSWTAPAEAATTTCSTLAANTDVSVQAAGRAGLPSAGVNAAVLSISVAQPTSSGYLRVAPGTSGGAGTISYTSGSDHSDVIVVPLDANGRFTLRAQHSVDVVIDVAGYFTVPDPGDPTGTVLDTVTPTRVADTRTATGTCTPGPCNTLAAATAKKFQVRGLAGVPGHATSVVAYVQVLNAAGNGYLRVNPVGSGMGSTGTATINYSTAPAGSTVIAPIASDGTITLVASNAVDVIIDVAGYLAPPLNTWGYGYDGDGYRATKTHPDASVTSFTWDRSDPIPKLLTQRTGTGGRTYVIYGPGGHPYAQITGSEAVHYHRDQLGSTRLLTDGDGDPVGSFTYDVYGKLTASTGTTTPLLGYAGEYTDAETGFTYLRARHYDPTTGQFLTRDPLEHATGDPHGYAANNPLNFTDPTGLAPWDGVVDFFTGGDCGDGFFDRALGGLDEWVWEHRDEIIFGLALAGTASSCPMCTAAFYASMGLGAVSTVHACNSGDGAGCALGVTALVTGGAGRALSRGAAPRLGAAADARLGASRWHPIQRNVTGPILRAGETAARRTGFWSGWTSNGLSGIDVVNG